HSVVKELIENSLDAGATQIDVQISEGGLARIVVIDDGQGMAADDAVLCFSRYATSKLKTAADLHKINSFGFRGEALASIASIAKVRLLTRQKHSELGRLVVLEAGKIVLVEDAGCPVGTRIEIENLFYNVPARLKFIKSPRSEALAVENVMRMASLAKTHVGFSLTSDDKLRFEVRQAPLDAPLGHERCLERAIASLGEASRYYLYPFAAKTDLLEISGYVTAPLVTRRDMRGIRLYVNQRPVEDKQLVQAVRVAYRSLLEVGRNPICALNIVINPELVDVNVHPRKSEVRFSDASRVQSHIIRLLSDFLAGTPWVKAFAPSVRVAIADIPNESKLSFYDAPLNKPATNLAPAMYTAAVSSNLTRETKVISYPSLDGHLRYAELKIVGQVDATFLLLEGSKSMIVLDQHAAHERVVFQRLKDELQRQEIKSQRMLFPLQIALSKEQALALEEHGNKFAKYGFEVDLFGETECLVKSIPADFRAQSAAEVILDVLDDLSNHQRVDSLDEMSDHICAQIACHSSIRAGQTLQMEEIKALLEELDKIEYGAHCPHGRPVMRAIPFGEMAKWFHRS
ncbi:MAG: DNA mismatch repair endonuclease MutL, partial [bacterium]|nr:DNA mismatch repair endonuclease MutL [bacterium]